MKDVSAIIRAGETGKLFPISFSEKPDAKGYVYAIQCGPYVKIGSAKNVGRRFAEIQKHNPEPLVLLIYRSVPAWAQFDFEFSLHQALAEYRHRDEWFALAACRT
jgi:hypothetical protein